MTMAQFQIYEVDLSNSTISGTTRLRQPRNIGISINKCNDNGQVKCAPQQEIDDFFENEIDYFGIHTQEKYLNSTAIENPFNYKFTKIASLKSQFNNALVTLSLKSYDFIDN